MERVDYTLKTKLQQFSKIFETRQRSEPLTALSHHSNHFYERVFTKCAMKARPAKQLEKSTTIKKPFNKASQTPRNHHKTL